MVAVTLRRHWFFGQVDAGRCPVLAQERLHLWRSQWPELMYEADARIELRKPCHTFLDAGHTNQDQTGATLIEDSSDLFEAGHSEPV
ncbi:MAG: hypothetical protein JWQ49_3586 [Edaphobacter sp.]|nr:hypothetical protein [Edaphobacter sp.]